MSNLHHARNAGRDAPPQTKQHTRAEVRAALDRIAASDGLPTYSQMVSVLNDLVTRSRGETTASGLINAIDQAELMLRNINA